jgi:hypothetical protein
VGSRCGCGGVPGGWGVPGCWAKSADNRPILKYFLDPGTLGSVPLLPSVGKAAPQTGMASSVTLVEIDWAAATLRC